MATYKINGGKKLEGNVTVNGAKNAALGIIAASVMTKEEVILENLPDVSDIQVMFEVLCELGVKVERKDSHTVAINPKEIKKTKATFPQMKKIRGSYYFLGSMIGRTGNITIPMPGGCKIDKDERPIDQHIKGLTALGATIREEKLNAREKIITANAEKLKGTKIYFDKVSVGTTINIMMAATLAEGLTILENVAKEPHIVDIANFLNSMGAKIKGAGTDIIRINGVESLHGTSYSIIPDQIEAGTYMCLAAATRSTLLIQNIIPEHLRSITSKLRDIGCEIEEYDEEIRVTGTNCQKGSDIKTLPYPGFPTDLQPPIAAVLSLAKGKSRIEESIWSSRFAYAQMLKEMGADINVEKDGTNALIIGKEKLEGGRVYATDLRGGAALVIAALSAQGESIIQDDEEYIKRGYEKLPEKIRGLNGEITEVTEITEATENEH